MSRTLLQINVAANDTFNTLITRLNQVINTISNGVVTVGTSASPDVSTGNGAVNGHFSVNTFYTEILYGGSIGNTKPLYVYSNLIANAFLQTYVSLTVGNSTSNLFCNSSILKIGSNVNINTSSISVGNSTVNLTLNSTSILIGNTQVGKTQIANNGTVVGTQSKLNFVANGIALDVINDANNDQVILSFTANGGLAVGGSNTHVQFSDGSTLGGSNSFTFNRTTNTLSVPILDFNSVSKIDTISANIVSGNNSIDSFFLTDYRSAEYVISIKNNSANAYQVSKILLVHDGNPYITEYGSIYTNTNIGTFYATSNATHIILGVVSSIANGSIKASRLLVAS